MRQLQSSNIDRLIAAVEQVDVNNSRNVLWMLPFAAQSFFDPNELLEQACGITLIFEFNHRI